MTTLNSKHLLYVCGMGPEQAKEGTRQLIDAGAKAILSWGTAGGLAPQLKAGDIVIPQDIFSHDLLNQYKMAPDWQYYLYKQAQTVGGKGKVFQEPIIHSPIPLKCPKLKSQYFNQGAIAVDMETLVIAEIAKNHQIPMACMRVIIDPAQFYLPQLATQALSIEGKFLWKKTLWNLIRYPNEWLQLLKLTQLYQQTQHSLRRLTSMDLHPVNNSNLT